jgi:excisionase family DNA binding protein
VTLRLAQSIDELTDDGEAVTVAEAARLLGCDGSTVRKLLKRRRLAGHHVGLGPNPRGVRVSLYSIQKYKQRNATGGDAAELEAAPARPRPRRANRAHDEAMAQLRQWGVRI